MITRSALNCWYAKPRHRKTIAQPLRNKVDDWRNQARRRLTGNLKEGLGEWRDHGRLQFSIVDDLLLQGRSILDWQAVKTPRRRGCLEAPLGGREHINLCDSVAYGIETSLFAYVFDQRQSALPRQSALWRGDSKEFK